MITQAIRFVKYQLPALNSSLCSLFHNMSCIHQFDIAFRSGQAISAAVHRRRFIGISCRFSRFVLFELCLPAGQSHFGVILG